MFDDKFRSDFDIPLVFCRLCLFVSYEQNGSNWLAIMWEYKFLERF